MADEAPKKAVPKWTVDAFHDRYKRSKKHENRVAESLSGRRLPRSGGLPWSKSDPTTAGGDIQTKDLLVEHKRTQHESMSIKLEWLIKVKEGAKRVNKDPALVVCFENTKRVVEEWIAVPLDVAKQRGLIP